METFGSDCMLASLCTSYSLDLPPKKLGGNSERQNIKRQGFSKFRVGVFKCRGRVWVLVATHSMRSHSRTLKTHGWQVCIRTNHSLTVIGWGCDSWRHTCDQCLLDLVFYLVTLCIVMQAIYYVGVCQLISSQSLLYIQPLASRICRGSVVRKDPERVKLRDNQMLWGGFQTLRY